MRNSRRTLLKFAGLLSVLLPRKARAGSLISSPVRRNRLRPPGAIREEVFPGKCIRCGRCVEVCPYRCIRPLDIRHGIFAGTPLIEVEQIPCYVCMKCVQVCPTGTLKPVHQSQVRMGLAVVDRQRCVSWKNEVLCRTCYNVCPFPERAIQLVEYRPVVDERHCTGCGLCVHACPMSQEDGSRAINVQPSFAFSPPLVDQQPS